MESPPVKIAFCECCLEKRERREFVGRVVRAKKDRPVHFRVCQGCNSYEDEEFYGNLTRKLINRILKQQNERTSGIIKYRFFGLE